MPRSLILPEATYEHFNTRVPVTRIARELGVTKLTLRRWWIERFGEHAYRERVASARVTVEEKKQRRREYHRRNQERRRRQKRDWNHANPERVAAYKQAYRENHRDEVRAYQRDFYARHPERCQEYREKNRVQINARTREYYSAHPEVMLFKGARKRAKERGLPFAIVVEDILNVIPVDGLCPITRMPFKKGDGKVGPASMTLDRIVPDLGYVRGNIAVISHLANTIKQCCTDPDVFVRVAEYVRIGGQRSKSMTAEASV